MSTRQQQANDFDEYRDVAEEGYHKNAAEFRLWLRSHLEHAQDRAQCLEALVVTLYVQMIRGKDGCDHEPEEIAAFFDAAVLAVDVMGEHHKLIHVSEEGFMFGLDDRVEFGASAGVRKLTWLKHTAHLAIEDAHEMIAQRERGVWDSDTGCHGGRRGMNHGGATRSASSPRSTLAAISLSPC